MNRITHAESSALANVQTTFTIAPQGHFFLAQSVLCTLIRSLFYAYTFTGVLCSQKYARYVPKIPQGRTHSYYPCHFNRYFPCQNVDRTQIAY
jgi:hypothetical protein